MTSGPAPPHRRPGQRRIGLTGGIATGKSTAGRLLRERFGVPVLDADRFARQALAPGSPASLKVLERYGAAVRGSDGIDRAALGRIVFTDPRERRWLEQLIHPLVRERFAGELERLASAPVVVLMVPLLFEAGFEPLCSEIWLVDCGEERQLERLQARDGLGEAEARSRIAAQWPMATKRARADLVLDNRGTVDQLAGKLRERLRERGVAVERTRGTTW
ncbi:MAG: dephospho-CoA kinase [Synechococcaceae cyanobacterium]|nr:dephospho-CoA kinase [Synechococcaceae cyanobacterium]